MQLNWRDILDSQRLSMRPVGWLGIGGFVLYGFVALFLLSFVCLWLSGSLTEGIIESLRYFWPVAVVVTALILLFNYAYLPWSSRRIFHQQKDLSKPYELEITPDALISSAEYGYSKRPWSEFRKWKEDQKLVILYFSDVLYTIIPKRFASEALLANILAHLRENSVIDANRSSLVTLPARAAPSDKDQRTPGRYQLYVRWIALGLLLLLVLIQLYRGFHQPLP